MTSLRTLIIVGAILLLPIFVYLLTERPDPSAPEVSVVTPETVVPAEVPPPVVVEPVAEVVEPMVEVAKEVVAEPVVEVSVVEVIPEPEFSKPDFVKYVALVSEMAAELNQPGKTVINDLDILDSLMSYYHSVFKSMPVAGDNVEFVDALVGMNEKGVQVLPHDHPSINEKGELEDRWGTPYFFHPISDRETEIISAGPDRTLFTDDDVQLR